MKTIYLYELIKGFSLKLSKAYKVQQTPEESKNIVTIIMVKVRTLI